MAGAERSRESWLWIAVAISVAAIFAALYPLQFVLDALRARNLLRLSVSIVFLTAGAVVILWMRRRGAGTLEWMVLAASAALYAAIALALEVPQERLHLVEYGALALLVKAALDERSRAFGRSLGDARTDRSAFAAFAASGAIGWCDEIVQGILPNRHYDPRDIALNLLAAGLALVTRKVLLQARAGGSPRRRPG